MSAPYDSGGKHRDQQKYAENYERIFGCKECKKKGGEHEPTCSKYTASAEEDSK